jgi:small-conductance mechanosensitive channel/CRP-like cAMP-binding protein
MQAMEVWLGPGFVLTTLLIALAATAISPPPIKRRLRIVLVLCLLAAVLIVAMRELPLQPHLQQAIAAAAYLFGALAAARTAFVLFIDIGWERAGRNPLNQLVRDVLQTIVYAVTAIVALNAAGIQPTSLIATGTVVTAIIGLSLQETLGNLAAGVALQVDQPMALGDWVRLDKGDVIGRVVSTNWRSVTIQGDDRLQIVVPNGYLSRSPFTNYSRPGGAYRRNIYFTVPYDVPPTHVHAAVLAACADTPNLLQDPPPTVLTWAFMDHGVQFWLRCFIGDFALRDRVQGELLTRIWFNLRRSKIDFAIPVRKNFVTEVDDEAIATRNAEIIADRRAALDGVDFLRPLSEHAKDMLARRGHRKVFAAGETIIRSGETGRELYVIRRGEVVIKVGSQELARLGPGDFVGELALLTGKERTANIVASDETEVFEIDEHMFKDVIQKEPKIAEEISRIVAERQAELDARVTGMPSTDHRTRSATTEILGKIRSLFGLD